jgi:hypothetical protein
LHFDNTFLENDDPQLSCLARSGCQRTIIPIVCRLCGVPWVAERGEASDGETATVCAGAVVRSGGYWRLRVVGDRDSRNADLEPRGGRRRERGER